MSDKEALTILKSQLEADYRFIEDNVTRHRDMAERVAHSADEEMAVIALAYTIHNVYTSIEGYFLRVAKFFENNLKAESWHRELLSRMTLDLPGIRPAIISRNIEEKLDELRRFRHLFRNLYKSSIRPNRVYELSSEIAPLMEAFAASHQGFMQWLDQLIREEQQSLNNGDTD